jgi:hypothetical protein
VHDDLELEIDRERFSWWWRRRRRLHRRFVACATRTLGGWACAQVCLCCHLRGATTYHISYRRAASGNGFRKSRSFFSVKPGSLPFFL